MALSTDPITGAPLISPDPGVIDQLPYKVQPVPLQDQTNQPQLGRTYLYPDDVPPVLANLNAMNGSQTDQAQTLHTDGEHRLLVSSDSGGVSTSVINTAANLRAWNSHQAGSERVLSNFNFTQAAHTLVFGISWAISFVVDAADGKNMYIYVGGDSAADAGNAFNVWGYSSFGGSDLPAGTVVNLADTLMFATPIDAARTWPNSTQAQIVGYSDRVKFLGSGTIYGGVL